VLAALMQRRRTGEGQTVTSSLLQTPIWSQQMLLSSLANTNGSTAEQSHSRDEPRNPLISQYLCADGRWVALAVLGPKQWPDVVTALELDAADTDPTLKEWESLAADATVSSAALDRHFLRQESEYWLARMREQGIWCSPVNHLHDMLTDEHVRQNGYLGELDDATIYVPLPFTLHGYQPPTRPGPDQDADRDQILATWTS
jgi:alpha-methylacyl-CoA racemase